MRVSLPRSLTLALAGLLLSLTTSRVVAQTTGNGSAQVGYYAPADAQFMRDMIGHHSQAVLISEWAPTHGASPAILRLTERIVNGQGDEIALMERWLEDHNEPIPSRDTSMAHMHHDMAGMDHAMMPGMLSQAQLDTLNAAQGPEFDRLFLRYMIQHHQGAVIMVNQLFGTQGAGEEERVFRFASDVYADQTTEIDRMEKMLAAMPPSGAGQ